MRHNWDLSRLWTSRLETGFTKAKINLDIIDSKFNVRYVDSAWRKIYGNPEGKKCYNYFMGRSRICPKCGIVKALRSRKTTITKEVLQKENNRPVEVITVPFKSGKEWLVAEINIDISQREHSIEALKESEERYRFLAEISPDIIFIVNKSGRLEYINTTAAKTYGGKVKDHIGQSIKELFPPKVAKRQLGHIKDVVRTGQPLYVEVQTPFPKGTLWLDTWLIPMKYPGKPVDSILGVSRDVTNRKLAEVSLKKSDEVLRRDKKTLEDLIEERSSELIAAHQELDQAKRLADIGALAATVAHELRNPLAAIRIASYNIRQKNANPAIDKNLINIEKKILESNQIINNLLFYSHIKPPHIEDLEIKSIITECINDSRNRFSEYNVSIGCDCPRDVIVRTDLSHMKEVLNNLLNNAYEAFPHRRGRIKITAVQKSKKVMIKISDNGMGMGEEDVEKAFDPFFTKKSKGVGLGLALCHKLISVNNGAIKIESKPGRGTTVTIFLPIP